MTSPSASPPFDSPTFASLGLSADSLRALESAGFTRPTPIQAGAIPSALQGRDVVGCAATGTGKTAAFALPLIEKLGGTTVTGGLVLAPTRELANQIAEQVERFSRGRGVRGAVLIGGVGMPGQVKAARGAQLIIATPGRLIDHLQQGTVRLDSVAYLVLDEADRMLDMGFAPQLKKILAKVPRGRQTMLFSATMAGEVADFARAHLRDPIRVEVNSSGTTAARADQRVYAVGQAEKTAALLALLGEDQDSTLVFTRTKHRADRVARALEKAGHSVARIHGDRSQNQREQALAGFKSYRFRILVATDIAARGIDVADIGHVVNFDLPSVPADYVHRVGRTARAAAAGRASSLASPEEHGLLRDIERFVRAPIPRAEVPRGTGIFDVELRALAERKVTAPQRPRANPNGPRPGRGRATPRGAAGGRRGGSGARPSGGGGARPSGGSGGGGKPTSVFSGGPKRRR